MTDAIKKMLEPEVNHFYAGNDCIGGCVSLEDFERAKRGFEKAIKQRNNMYHRYHAATGAAPIEQFKDDAELEAVMMEDA